MKKSDHSNGPMGYMSKDVVHMIHKLKTLAEISKKPIYSYALIEKFSGPNCPKFLKGNTKSMKNDIYNTINALERSGYIKLRPKIEGGKLKNYCYITPSGRKALAEAKKLLNRSRDTLIEIIK